MTALHSFFSSLFLLLAPFLLSLFSVALQVQCIYSHERATRAEQKPLVCPTCRDESTYQRQLRQVRRDLGHTQLPLPAPSSSRRAAAAAEVGASPKTSRRLSPATVASSSSSSRRSQPHTGASSSASRGTGDTSLRVAEDGPSSSSSSPSPVAAAAMVVSPQMFHAIRDRRARQAEPKSKKHKKKRQHARSRDDSGDSGFDDVERHKKKRKKRSKKDDDEKFAL